MSRDQADKVRADLAKVIDRRDEFVGVPRANCVIRGEPRAQHGTARRANAVCHTAYEPGILKTGLAAAGRL
jgi:hypothetical protein